MFRKSRLSTLALLAVLISGTAQGQTNVPASPGQNRTIDQPWTYEPQSVPNMGGTYQEESIAVMTYCTKDEVEQLTSDQMVQRMYVSGGRGRGGVSCPCAEQSYMYYGLQRPFVKYPEVQYVEVTSIVNPESGIVNQSNYPWTLDIANAYLYLQMLKKHPDAQPMGILGCYKGAGSSSIVVPPVTSTTPSIPNTTQSSTNPTGNSVLNGAGTSALAAGLADNGNAARSSIDKYAFCRRPGRSQASIDNCMKAIAQ